MPVPIRFDFVPPAQDDVVALRIYESSTEGGIYSQIERTTDVGVYPTYISHYTTQNALSSTDWFKIAWEMVGDVIGPTSPPIQGGSSQTLISRVIERVMQRDGTLDESVVGQEAEGAISGYYGVDDPYDPDLTATYRQLNGLVYLVLARSQLVKMLASASSSTADSFTIGLVSAKAESGTATQVRSEAAIKKLLDMAMADLGIPLSLILELAEPTSSVGLTSSDHSRLIGWVGLE